MNHKLLILKLFVVCSLVFLFSEVRAQSYTCDENIDFEYGDYRNWTFFQGTCCAPLTITTPVTSTTSASAGRIALTSSTSVVDFYGGFPIVSPGGGTYSLKIGQEDKLYKSDLARYFIHVPSGSTEYALIYRYAVVLEDPAHLPAQQPRFLVITRDSATKDSIPCGNFTYIAGGTLPGFVVSPKDTEWYYKPWSTAIIKLSGYAGRTVMVDFARGNCGLSAHSAYGYIDMTCGLFAISKNVCNQGGSTSLTGPPGFNTYLWMDSSLTTTIGTTETVTIPTPSVTTTYKLIIAPYVGYGCPDTLTTKIVISDLNAATSDTSICRGKSVTLTATASGEATPLTYKWTPSTGLSCSTCLTPSLTAANSTKYVFSVTDSNGCSRNDTANLTVNYLKNYLGTRNICIGDSTSITASSATSHFWTPTAGLNCSTCVTVKASPSVNTSYNVDITDTNGCVNIDSIYVRVNPLPSVSAPNINICKGDTTILYASGGHSLTWSPSAGLSCTSCSNPLASPSNTGNYVVTATDSNGCAISHTFLFKVLPLPLVSAPDRVICSGDTISMSVSGATSYTWFPSLGLSCSTCPSPLATATVTTSYIVKGIDSNTCVNWDTVALVVNTVNTTNTGNKTICFGDTATLSVSGASSYVWNPSTGLSCSTCSTTKASPLVTTTYVATSTDSNSCTHQDTLVVKVNPLPALYAADKSVCIGDTVVLSASGATSYTWSPPTDLSCYSCSSPTVFVVRNTDYVVTGIDTNLCVNKDTVSIKVNPLPLVEATNKIHCKGGSALLGALGAHTYNWSPSYGLSCTNCKNPTATLDSNTTFIVTGVDTNACVGRDTILIQISPLPKVLATDKYLCFGDSTLLSASGASRYTWSPGIGLSCISCSSPMASPDATYEYIVTGADSLGCRGYDTIFVEVLTRPTVNATNKTMCYGDSVLLSTTSMGDNLHFSWSPTQGLACDTCANTKASPELTTTYVISVIDSNGCQNKDTIVITVNPLPILNSVNKTICNGDSTLLSVSGASSFSWTPTAGLACINCASTLASPPYTTTYIVTGTDVNLCSSKDTITVSVNSLPTLHSTDKSVCFGDSVFVSVSGAQSYLWSPTTGLSCTTCSSPKVSPIVSTKYFITATDSNTCKNIDSILVTVNQLPIINSSADKALCYGDSVLLNTSGAANYTWSPASGLSCVSCPNPVANPVVSTVYVIIGTDSNLCVGQDTIRVKVNSLPLISATDKSICIGDTTSLNAIGGTLYVWSPAIALSCITCANPNAMPITTTSYVVTGRDSNSCINKDTITVKVNLLPIVDAPDKTICLNDTVSLKANGAESYSWSPSLGLTCTNCSSPVASPLATTMYILEGLDSNSCRDRDSVWVTVNPLPNVNSANKAICDGDTTILHCSGAINYIWTPSTGLDCNTCGSTKASPEATTQYIIKGTDSNNCSNNDTIILTVHPLPKVSASDKVFCLGKGATLNATGAATYLWSPSVGLSCATCANPLVTSTISTSYILMGIDLNSCSNKDTVLVTVHPLPLLNSSGDKAVCFGDSISLTTAGAQSYLWSPSSGLSCINCPNPIASPITTTTYTISGTDSNSCVNFDTVTVKVNLLPILLASDQSLCKGQSTIISVSGAERYKWNPPTYLSCDTCAFATTSPDSNIKYQIKGTDANGCSNVDSVFVRVHLPLQVSVDSVAPICRGEQIFLNAFGSHFYLWSPAFGLSCANCATSIATPTATTEFTVVSTDSNTCKDTAKLTVIVHPKPTLKTSADTVLCEGSLIQLYANGADAYLWLPATSLSCNTCDSPFTNTSEAITYTVIGSNSYGCKDTTQINISVLKKQAIAYSMGDTICSGQLANLYASGGSSYLWIPAEGLNNDTISNPVANPQKSILYKVIIKQGNCFKDTVTVPLLVYPTPTVEVTGDTEIYIGEKAHLYSSGDKIETYIWTPNNYLDCSDCPNPIATIEQTTSFLLVVKGEGDCESRDTITIRVRCDQAKVFIPNTFTPNGDGENDRFFPMGSGISLIKDFSVYNRWGELMFQSKDIKLNSPDDGWDGSFKGKQLSPDVYIYYITATCLAGEEIKFKGNISLVK